MLYAALLWASRGALVKGVPSPLSQATAFLSGDYLGHAFWWEPVEMCRKLVLTGWVALIQNDRHAEQARVLLALVVSIALLVVRVSVKPFDQAVRTEADNDQRHAL